MAQIRRTAWIAGDAFDVDAIRRSLRDSATLDHALPRFATGVWSVPLVCGVTEEQVQVLNHAPDAGCSPECQSCIIRFSVEGGTLQQ